MGTRNHIIIEANIPFVRGLLDDQADVSYLAPSEITPEAMRDADALITRTRTRCDADLLSDSRCRFIGSATIGLDHVDQEYCRTHGIKVVNAPGCNAPAVAQYVISSLLHIYGEERLRGMTLAIVGVGHVGSIVERWATQLGLKVLPVDPPRAEVEGTGRFVNLQTALAQADIITFHTPYTRAGEHPTHHLLDASTMALAECTPLIINSARGPVVDNTALVSALDSGIVSGAVIDCWEGEPAIDRRLLDMVHFGTPHIAGYSYEGKVRATTMVIQALCNQMGLRLPQMPQMPPATGAERITARAVMDSYDPAADTALLRKDPSLFESLRNHYDLRHEPHNQPI